MKTKKHNDGGNEMETKTLDAARERRIAAYAALETARHASADGCSAPAEVVAEYNAARAAEIAAEQAATRTAESARAAYRAERKPPRRQKQTPRIDDLVVRPADAGDALWAYTVTTGEDRIYSVWCNEDFEYPGGGVSCNCRAGQHGKRCRHIAAVEAYRQQ
jgi:multidrug efflux pump subunit AcrA (membrane-fusion protein)